jgi:signal transduction histidine kinase
MAESPSARILVIDGDPSVHEELDRILGAPEAGDRPLAKLRSMIFGEPAGEARATGCEVVHAASGDEGAALLRAAVLEGRPCACALVDLGTAPAWEGLATVETLAAIDPDLPIVVATALADRSWEDAVRRTKGGERLLMLKKPFEGAEIRQLAIALAAQRELARDGRARIAELESLVASRNHDLAAANDVLRTRLSQTILARRKAQDAILALQASNRDLERARSEALDASRSKSEFLTSMSHEIRTPMTAILGYAELLGEAGLSRDEVTRHVTTIRKNGEHLLALISDILDVSRIEAGMVSVERSACSPGTILAAVVELMSVRASAKGLRIVLEAPSPLPKTIQTDETRFQQILLNLVGNAIKFTDIGSVRLVARIVEAREGSGPWLAVDVQDTGIGLAPEQIGLLFKPFSRVDGSSSRRYGGTGLGLSISRKLAEHLGGTVTVQSRTGDGSTFTATGRDGPAGGDRARRALAADALRAARRGGTGRGRVPRRGPRAPRRRRRGQPAAGALDPLARGCDRRSRGRRAGSVRAHEGRAGQGAAVRPRADGHADARARRLPDDRRDAADRVQGADPGVDRTRDGGRPRALPRGGLRRVRDEADPAASAAGRVRGAPAAARLDPRGAARARPARGRGSARRRGSRRRRGARVAGRDDLIPAGERTAPTSGSRQGAREAGAGSVRKPGEVGVSPGKPITVRKGRPGVPAAS